MLEVNIVCNKQDEKAREKLMFVHCHFFNSVPSLFDQQNEKASEKLLFVH